MRVPVRYRRRGKLLEAAGGSRTTAMAVMKEAYQPPSRAGCNPRQILPLKTGTMGRHHGRTPLSVHASACRAGLTAGGRHAPAVAVCPEDNPSLTVALALDAHERSYHDDAGAIAYQARGCLIMGRPR